MEKILKPEEDVELIKEVEAKERALLVWEEFYEVRTARCEERRGVNCNIENMRAEKVEGRDN